MDFDDEFDGSEPSAFRVCAVLDGSPTAAGKTVNVKRHALMKDMLLEVCRSLGVTVTTRARIFNVDGNEIDDVSMLADGDTIILSPKGHPPPPRTSAATKRPPKPTKSPPKRGKSSTSTRKTGDRDVVRSVGPYKVLRLLGEGGFGAVRLGVSSSQEFAALKFISKTAYMSAGDADRIITEISCLTELVHPNIIRLLEVFNEPEHMVLALAFAPGGDLRSYVSRQRGNCASDDANTSGCMTEADASDKFAQIVKGVAYAHARKVAHRDLKLENILLGPPPSSNSSMAMAMAATQKRSSRVKSDADRKREEEENTKQCMITDFGLSQFTRPGEVKVDTGGSLYYMAPEILRGLPTNGQAIDVWCLGVMLYAMLTGKTPFRSPTLDRAAARLEEEHRQLRAVKAATQRSMAAAEASMASDRESAVTGRDSVVSGRLSSLLPDLSRDFVGGRTERANTFAGIPECESSASADTTPVHREVSDTAISGGLRRHDDEASALKRAMSSSNLGLAPPAVEEPSNPLLPRLGSSSRHIQSSPSLPRMPLVRNKSAFSMLSNGGSNGKPASPPELLGGYAAPAEIGSECGESSVSRLTKEDVPPILLDMSDVTGAEAEDAVEELTPRDYEREAEEVVDIPTVVREIRNAILAGVDKVSFPPWVAEEAVSLIKSMLNPDAEKRPSAAEIITHPWFLMAHSREIPGDSETKSRMVAVRALTTGQRVALAESPRLASSRRLDSVDEGSGAVSSSPAVASSRGSAQEVPLSSARLSLRDVQHQSSVVSARARAVTLGSLGSMSKRPSSTDLTKAEDETPQVQAPPSTNGGITFAAPSRWGVTRSSSFSLQQKGSPVLEQVRPTSRASMSIARNKTEGAAGSPIKSALSPPSAMERVNSASSLLSPHLPVISISPSQASGSPVFISTRDRTPSIGLIPEGACSPMLGATRPTSRALNRISVPAALSNIRDSIDVDGSNPTNSTPPMLQSPSGLVNFTFSSPNPRASAVGRPSSFLSPLSAHHHQVTSPILKVSSPGVQLDTPTGRTSSGRFSLEPAQSFGDGSSGSPTRSAGSPNPGVAESTRQSPTRTDYPPYAEGMRTLIPSPPKDMERSSPSCGDQIRVSPEMRDLRSGPITRSPRTSKNLVGAAPLGSIPPLHKRSSSSALPSPAVDASPSFQVEPSSDTNLATEQPAHATISVPLNAAPTGPAPVTSVSVNGIRTMSSRGSREPETVGSAALSGVLQARSLLSPRPVSNSSSTHPAANTLTGVGPTTLQATNAQLLQQSISPLMVAGGKVSQAGFEMPIPSPSSTAPKSIPALGADTRSRTPSKTDKHISAGGNVQLDLASQLALASEIASPLGRHSRLADLLEATDNLPN